MCLFFSEKPHLLELATSTWGGANDLSGGCGICWPLNKKEFVLRKKTTFSIICCVCLLPWQNRINPKLLEPWQSFGWRNWAPERGSELPKPHDGLAAGTRERWRPLSGNDRNWHRLVPFWFLAIGVSSLMQSYSFAKSPTKGNQVSFFYTDFHTKQKDGLAEKTPTAWLVSLDREGFKW